MYHQSIPESTTSTPAPMAASDLFRTEKPVFRSFALPVSAFDHLKTFQRGYEALHRVRLTNNQALGLILSQHQHMVPIAVAAAGLMG